MIYPRVYNSVHSIPFQLSQNLPNKIAPLHQQLSVEVLQGLVDEAPAATLKQLCTLAKDIHSVTMSTTAMCRLIKRHRVVPRRYLGLRAASFP